jgi:hypothetical protein
MLTGTSGTPPLLRVSVNLNGQLLTDVRHGVEAVFVTYDGTTFTETASRSCLGYLLFDALTYTQTGGAAVYSIPASFSQLEG